MLTAARVCVPLLPKTSLIKSDAPLITFGCSIKSSVELTKPVNLIHDLIFDKSLPQDFFACATKPKAHLIAALYPFSVFSSFPSLPLIKSPFSSIEI